MSDTQVTVPSTVLVFAFRYALGRQTAGVAVVAAQLIAQAAALSGSERSQMIRDIDLAIQTDSAGDDMDVTCWQRVRALFDAMTEGVARDV